MGFMLMDCTGESHSALILLYRAIDLPTAEEVKEDVPMTG